MQPIVIIWQDILTVHNALLPTAKGLNAPFLIMQSFQSNFHIQVVYVHIGTLYNYKLTSQFSS